MPEGEPIAPDHSVCAPEAMLFTRARERRVEGPAADGGTFGPVFAEPIAESECINDGRSGR